MSCCFWCLIKRLEEEEKHKQSTNPFNVAFREFWEVVEWKYEWKNASTRQKIIWQIDKFCFILMPRTWLRHHHPETWLACAYDIKKKKKEGEKTW